MTQLNEISFTEFKSIIINSAGHVEEWCFAQSRNCFFADYRPSYPEKTAADFTIVLDHSNIRPRFTIYQDTATLPTIKQYSTVKSLTADLIHMK
jgi:hypothetical protein